jgi:hypothetical protein
VSASSINASGAVSSSATETVVFEDGADEVGESEPPPPQAAKVKVSNRSEGYAMRFKIRTPGTVMYAVVSAALATRTPARIENSTSQIQIHNVVALFLPDVVLHSVRI